MFASHHEQEHDSKTVYLRLLGVLFFLQDFGSSIAWSSWFRTVAMSIIGCEAEVDEEGCVVLGEQDVFWLNISMQNIPGV